MANTDLAPLGSIWSAEQLQVITQVLAPGLKPAELLFFANMCQQTGLDPFSRQIVAYKRGDRLAVHPTIDGFRAIAEATGDYRGQLGPMWCGDDGIWVDVWLKKEHPAACKVGVCREGWAPLWQVGLWSTYVPSYPSSVWERMGAHMLAKCVEELALRRAFPRHLRGLYGVEEMQQSEPPLPEVKRATITRDKLGGVSFACPPDAGLSDG